MKLSQYKLILFSAIFFVLFDNISFFKNVIITYPLSGLNILFVFSIAVVLLFFILFLFSLVASKYTTKPLLITAIMISAFTNYFMNSYNVVIDYTMIQNSLETNLNESLDLFSFKLVLYVLFLGLLPSYIVYKLDIEYGTLKSAIIDKLKYTIGSLLVIVIIIFSFSKYYTSFFREHKTLRYYSNPTYWIYSVGKYINMTLNSGPIVVKSIGLDAKIDDKDYTKKQIVVMVVGEASRANRFSLNGYEKETNPLLKSQDIINFENFYSCGTTTAVSVPCMFSIYGNDDFNYKRGIDTQNVIDVLSHTDKISILWRDNNSDSKGVALRIEYQDYKSPKNNPICDDECRDEGMLIGLDKYIEKNKDKDILIVLHQMGNHGPAYYKRYTKEFEKFKPVCKTNQLENCTQETIGNAYDNGILYTDYFLNKTIEFLKPYSKEFETSMIYMSDHGESLGENGIYLHGMPYFMAPDNQKHIGALMWFDENMKKRIDTKKLENLSSDEYSQDSLFHTLLGIFDVKTQIYKKDMDILSKVKKD